MKSDSANTISIWMDTVDMPQYSRIGEDARSDVCIIGAGIAGLSCAYLLGKAGRKVIVLDDGPVGMGETSRTTAHIAPAIDDRYFKIEAQFGVEGSRQYDEEARSASSCIEATEHV